MSFPPPSPSQSDSAASPPDTPRTAKGVSVYFLNLPPDALDVARKAAELAFPHEPVKTVTDPADIDTTHSEHCVVVTDRGELGPKLAPEGGAPLYAVVLMGRDHSEFAETVPPEEWNPPLLARV